MQDVTNPTRGMQVVEERVGRPIAEYLRDAYVVQELNQWEIAQAVGVDEATISRWLRVAGIPTRVIGHRKRRRNVA